jgi:thiamine biosynthesis protein ThiI
MTEPLTNPFEWVILARLGEITLKGMNRVKFEQQAIKNMRYRLSGLGSFSISQSQSRIWVESPLLQDESLREAVMERLTSIFGLVSVSPVRRFSGGIEAIEQQAIAFTGDLLSDRSELRFKVETRRGDKKFPLDSPQISERIGGLLAHRFAGRLLVDVRQPDFILYIEVRNQIYLYSQIIASQRGLPVGTGGTGLLLLSGGIDSPVAGYLMASRGMRLEAIYFHTHPFTSDQALQKVIDLAGIVGRYSGNIRLNVVDFTQIQLKLRDLCPPDMLTIVMRRMMMRIADRYAAKRGLKALITGESLGQVASQTLEAIVTTDCMASRPVFRPLIGMNKDETVTIARRIGTFDTSIQPFEDCCTVFVAKHPKTHPSQNDALAAEKDLNIDELVWQGLHAIQPMHIVAQLESKG